MQSYLTGCWLFISLSSSREYNMKPNLASRLKRRIIIEQPIEEFDEHGGLTTSYRQFAAVAAEINPIYGIDILGAEYWQFMQLTNRDIFMITIRYLPGLTTKMRVKFKSRSFDIKRLINPFEENQLWKIIAIEGE